MKGTKTIVPSLTADEKRTSSVRMEREREKRAIAPHCCAPPAHSPVLLVVVRSCLECQVSPSPRFRLVRCAVTKDIWSGLNHLQSCFMLLIQRSSNALHGSCNHEEERTGHITFQSKQTNKQTHRRLMNTRVRSHCYQPRKETGALAGPLRSIQGAYHHTSLEEFLQC